MANLTDKKVNDCPWGMLRNFYDTFDVFPLILYNCIDSVGGGGKLVVIFSKISDFLYIIP